jgi:hypothetical protein
MYEPSGVVFIVTGSFGLTSGTAIALNLDELSISTSIPLQPSGKK